MELTIAAVATTAVGYAGVKFIRRHTNTTVNCWFCNENSKVPYAQKNSFDCLSCGQYNGFNESGDYNKRIPGQKTIGTISNNGRYCVSSKSEVPKGNGLCDPCNIKQGTIMKQIADFEPINENRWEEELEEFKYKLDKVYALCTSCSIYAHRKLEDDKRQFSYLLNLRDTIIPGVKSACRNVVKLASRVTRRHRRQFFAGGKTTEISHLFSLFLTTVLFFGNLHFLQEDAGVEFVNFPEVIQPVLPYLVYYGKHILLVSLLAHLLALYSNKNRTTLPDLIYPATGVALLLTYFVPEKDYQEDLILFRCAFTSFMIILSSAITFVPRKKLHRKRPNKILHSAFSVASTPASQCSTINDSSIFESDEERSNTPPLVKNRMNWREKAQTPEPSAMNITCDKSPEDMDWETSTVSTSVASLRSAKPFNRFTGLREATPSRELAPSLSSLSLANGQLLRKSTLSKFSPEKNHAFPSFTSDILSDRFKTPSVFGSQRGPQSVSAFSSVSKRTMKRMNDSPVLPEPSVFTSISQQNGSSLSAGMKFIIGTLVFSSFLGNVAFFYFMFRMQSTRDS